MLKDLKIKTRLLIGFGTLMAMGGLMALTAFITTSILSREIDDVSKRRMAQSMAVSNLSEAIVKTVVLLQKAALEDNKEALDRAIAQMLDLKKDASGYVETLKASVRTPEGKKKIETVISKRGPMGETREAIIKALQAGNKKEAHELFRKIEPLMDAYSQSVKDMDAFIQKRTKESNNRTDSTVLVCKVAIVGLATAATLFAALMVIWVIRSITRPINDAVSTAEKIAGGNLTVKIEEAGNNETGKLLGAMQSMAEKLKGIIGDIKQASASMASGSEQLSASSEQITRTMADQSGRATQIATAAEELSQTVLDIARNAASIAEASSETANIAHKGEDVVNKSVAESREIAKTVQNSAEVVRLLGDKSKQIGEIIAVINDIADQTNLLALNAAIEAARAGEQGRGFAVVADEVRKLAERTSKATSEIGQMIGAIQGEVGNAVKAMDVTTEKVNVGLQYSIEAGEQLSSIVKSVTSLQGMVHQIAAATEEMSATSESISGDVQAVASGATEISSGSHQIAQSSSELARLAGQLKGAVDQFKV